MRELFEDFDWGTHLTDDEFASAVVAVGLLAGARLDDVARKAAADQFADWAFDRWMATEAPLPWGNGTVAWKAAMGDLTPDEARVGWNAFTDRRGDVLRPGSDRRRPLRLHVRWFAYPWPYGPLYELFAMPGAQVDAVSYRPKWSRRRTAWHWPLRVGWWPSSEGVALIEDVRTNGRWFYETLLHFVDPQGSDDACDLFLVPHAVASEKIPRQVLKASAVLWFGAPLPLTDADSVQRIVDAVGASACAVLPNEASPGDYAGELFAALSHDEPLDVAANIAAREFGTLPAWVLADSDLLARTRVKTTAWRFARQLESAGYVDDAMEVHRQSRTEYIQESGGATIVARAMAAARNAAPRKPRYLQATVVAPGDGEQRREWREVRGVQRGVWHGVSASIAALAEGVESKLEPFPDAELPRDDPRHHLRVALTAPDCLVVSLEKLERFDLDRSDPKDFDLALSALDSWEGEPSDAATCSTVLPAQGASSPARFLLMPLTDEPVQARLSVVYENRVLQTALLKGPVVRSRAEALESKEGIELLPEGIVRASLDELEDRRRFDATVVFNRNPSGASQATVIRDGDIELLEVSAGVEATIDVGDVLVALTDRPEDFEKLDSAPVRKLLIDLALKGKKIRDHFVRDAGLLKNLKKPIERIQILSTKPESDAPLEFVYEGAAPIDGAPLCPNHAKALQDGSCGDCPHQTGRDHVCPTRFWGLTKVIERHKYLPGSKHVRLNEAIGARTAMPSPAVAVAAWSDKASAFTGGKQVIADLTASVKAVATTSACVKKWSQWEQAVTDNPSLLLLLPHTGWSGTDAVLMIGKAEEVDEDTDAKQKAMKDYKLVDARIDEPHVGHARPARMVLLLGCSTADPSRRYTSVPSCFRHAGADIVVATLTDVLGAHAAPSAQAILDELHECWNKTPGKWALGDVITRLRRRLLEKGLPFGMALVAYGDADWKLG